MSDLIDRQAAIDALWRNQKVYLNNYVDDDTIEKYAIIENDAKTIAQLPSADQDRWILCSERLPEKHQMVITTIIGTDVIRMSPGETFEDALARVRNHVRVSVGYIGDDGWYGADGFPQIIPTVAWMPMPEPWKGEEDGRS